MKFTQKYKWLVPPLTFTLALIAIRVVVTENIAFLFIPWNLFLAFLPLYFSHYLAAAKSKKIYWLCMALWLLFFPNAMYIITDMFHLKERDEIPMWYDLLILFSAAISGLVIGFMSLYNVEQSLMSRVPKKFLPLVIFSFFGLSGYGIYLGRYLRWNSWDIVTEPVSLLFDIKQDIVHPIRNQECWMLTVLFAVWMYLMYNYFKRMKITL